MQEATEANRETLSSTTSGRFLSRDSWLLSDYLHHRHHARKAGKRLIHRSTPLILSPSKRLFIAPVIQREDAEPLWKSSLKGTSSSSANSMSGPKESSESFIARECSSQAFSQLDNSRWDSGCMYRTTLSSLPHIETIECDESGAEATTSIHTSGGSLKYSRSSSTSKEGNALADNHGRVSTDKQEGSHLADLPRTIMPSIYNVSLDSMTGVDLLVNAAMQVEFLNNQDFQISEASFAHVTDNAGNTSDFKFRNACPLQLNSPILRKRVIRRARSAISKQRGKDLLHRLGIFSSETNATKKPVNVAEKNANCISSTKATRMQQQKNSIQYVRRKPSKALPTGTYSYANVLDDGSKNGLSQEDLQVALAEICKQKVKGFQRREKHCKLKQQKCKLNVPTDELVHPGNAVKLEFDENYEVAFGKEKVASFREMVDCGSEETAAEANIETIACIKFGGSEIRVQFRPVNLSNKAQMEALQLATIKQDTTGSGMTRRRESLGVAKRAEVSTKGTTSSSADSQHNQAENDVWMIRSATLSSQESNKFETPEDVSQGNLTGRKSAQLLLEERAGKRNPNIKLIEGMHCDSSNSLSTQSSPLVRSKRGRSQVLPSKFSDSVLQPWKRAYRKKC